MHLCSSRQKKDPHERVRAHTSFRLTKEEADAIGEGVRQKAPRGYGGGGGGERAPEPEPEQEPRDSGRLRRGGQWTSSRTNSVQPRGPSETARDQSVHQSVRQSVVPAWTRQKLSSEWSEEKGTFVGVVGVVVSIDAIGNQVELSFGEAHLLRKLIYPVAALGLRKKSALDRPLEDATILIGLGLDGPGVKEWCEKPENDWEVQVRDDPKLVEDCFAQQNMPFVEVFGTDLHAVTTCGVAFFTSWALGFVVETLGLGWMIHLLLALPVWVYVAYNAIFLERQRVSRIEGLSERKAKDRRNRTSTLIPDDENVEWLNAVLRKVWGPLEPGVSKSVHDSIQCTLDEMVMEPYLSEIRLADFALGQNPPAVQLASYEDSDVYGEFKINLELEMVAPEIKVDARAVVCIGGLELQVPVKVSDVMVELDLQLIVRMSEE